MSMSFDFEKEYANCRLLYQQILQSTNKVHCEELLDKVNGIVQRIPSISKTEESGTSDIDPILNQLQKEISSFENIKNISSLFEKVFSGIEKHLRQKEEPENLLKEFKKFWDEPDFKIEGEKFEHFMSKGLMPFLTFGKVAINQEAFSFVQYQKLPVPPHNVIAQKVKKHLEERFPAEKIICLYPGGANRIEHPLNYVDCDTIVIMDPDPTMRQQLCPEDRLTKWFEEKINRLNSTVISKEILSVKEKSKIAYASNVGIKMTFEYQGKLRTLYVFTRGSGEEFFEGTPVRQGAHVLLTKLPTFDSSPSFLALKNGGLFICFTPSRDGRDIRGSIWQDAKDYSQIPTLLKKEGIFTDLEKIKKLEKLAHHFDALFITHRFEKVLLLEAASEVYSLIGESSFKSLMKEFYEIGRVRLDQMWQRIKNDNLSFLPAETIAEAKKRVATIEDSLHEIFKKFK